MSTKVFFFEFSDYMESVITSTEKLVILGDVNVHVMLMRGKIRIFSSV